VINKLEKIRWFGHA